MQHMLRARKRRPREENILYLEIANAQAASHAAVRAAGLMPPNLIGVKFWIRQYHKQKVTLDPE